MLMIWKPNVHTENLKSYYKRRFWAGILLAQAVLFYLLSLSDRAVSVFESFFAWQKQYHQLFFSGPDFSVGDILYIVLVIVFGFIILGVITKREMRGCLLLLLLS